MKLLIIILCGGMVLAQTPVSRVTTCTDSSGAANTITCTPTPAETAYSAGQRVRVKVANTVTGATTINISALGAKSIVKLSGGVTTALAANDIYANAYVELVYDGTNFQMLSQLGNAGGGGVTVNANPGGGLCWDGTQFLGPRAAICGMDDFVGGLVSTGNIGQLGWTFSANGGCTNNIAIQTADAEEFGIYRLGCSTTTAGQNITSSLNKWGTMTNRTNWRISYGFKLGQTTGTRFRVGFSANQSTAVSTSFLGLAADDDSTWDTSGSGVGNFKMMICNASTDITNCDVYNTGVAKDTNAHYFSVFTTTSGTYSMTFDSTTKTFCASGCDVTTSHVPATSVEFWPMWVVGSQDAASRSAYMHWFSYFAALSR